MFSIKRMIAGLGVLMLGLGSGSPGLAAENLPANDAPKERFAVDIGMPRTLFQGYSETMMRLGAGPFKKMMKDNTGIDGTIHFPEDALKLATLIDAGKIHIGVLSGHEFAWAKSKYPDLMPIAVAQPMDPIQSFCVVKWDCKAENIGQLKGDKLALPPLHRDYCELFLAKQKEQHMKGAAFTAQLNRSIGEDAIYDVIEGRAGCALVDCSTLMFFKSFYPGQFKNLKILCQSEVFPNACIAVSRN